MNKVPLPIKQSFRDNSNVSDKRAVHKNMYNHQNSDSLGTNEFNNVSIEQTPTPKGNMNSAKMGSFGNNQRSFQNSSNIVKKQQSGNNAANALRFRRQFIT